MDMERIGAGLAILFTGFTPPRVSGMVRRIE
jgi:hypothetical protein